MSSPEAAKICGRERQVYRFNYLPREADRLMSPARPWRLGFARTALRLEPEDAANAVRLAVRSSALEATKLDELMDLWSWFEVNK